MNLSLFIYLAVYASTAKSKKHSALRAAQVNYIERSKRFHLSPKVAFKVSQVYVENSVTRATLESKRG